MVDARRTALGTGVLSRLSDRAKAFVQRAEKGLECLSMPDFFHGTPDMIKSYALAMGRCGRHAHQELHKAEEALTRRSALPHGVPEHPEAQPEVAATRAAVRRWEAVQRTYRHQLEVRSLTLPPCRVSDAAPQTSAQVESHRQAAVEAIEAFAQRHQWPARHDAMAQVRKQGPALAARVDCWWPGIAQDGEPCRLSHLWRSWGDACLLPLV